MESVAHSHRILQFGIYEADPAAGELRKHGTRIKIQEQPFQILLLLLEHPGELVSRETLRSKLWASDTFVDFDRSLNTAITKLRIALYDSADNPRFIETVPRHGYRFIAPISTRDRDSGSSTTAEPVIGPARITLAQERPELAVPRKINFPIRGWLAGSTVVLALAVAIYYTHSRPTKTPSPPAIVARRSVAVLGFKNLTADSSHAWLSTALSDWLSAELAAGEHLRVIPEENVARMKVELGLPQVDSLASDSLARIKKNLGSDLVVVGSFASLSTGSDANIRVDVRLQETTTGETVATVSESGTESRLFDLVSQTGEQLREKLGVESVTPQETAEVAVTLPANRAAAQLYSEGLNKLRSFDALAARDLLQRVVVIEPNAALPHSALATAWQKLGYDSAAVAEARKASDLSAGLPGPQRLLVQARYQEVSRNWEKAIQTYQSLFQSFPDNIDYGLALANAQVVGARWNDALSTLAVLRNLPPSLNEDPRIDWQEGRAARSLGDMKRAEAAFAAAVHKSEAAGATLLLARALVDDASAFENLGSYEHVGQLVERAKQLYTGAHDPDGVAVATTHEATLLQLQGDSSGALKNYEQSLAMYQSIGDKAGIAGEETNIAGVLLDQADLLASRSHVERARDVYREIGEPDGVALAEQNLGEVLLASGQLLQAKQMFEDSRRICVRTSNRTREAAALAGLSEVMRIEGDIDNAIHTAKEAQSIFTSGGERLEEAHLNLTIAELMSDKGEISKAKELASKTLELSVRTRSAGEQAFAHLVLARLLLRQKRFAEAEGHIDAAITIARKSNFHARELEAAILRAQVNAASAHLEDRVEAANALDRIIADARKAKLLPQEFEARLALGNAEFASGKTATAQKELSRLKVDALQRGWRLIAERAAADLNEIPHS
ncbi:MAG TPA: tetratricopeptide repeat protein [Terriglobales bacterium]|nr:tetratricopeptide repeat protein [Terriglobales bacterium]